MKNKIVLILILFSCMQTVAQQQITWADLAAVRFEERFFPDFNENLLYPHFSWAVKQLDGQQVSIVGYFLDIDPEGDLYILSQGPMSACFFCGMGGPETAIELEYDNKDSFKTDDIVVITGVLRLNSEDPMHFNYILSDVKAKLFE